MDIPKFIEDEISAFMEINAGKGVFPDGDSNRARRSYLNNFHLHFPSDGYLGFYRDEVERTGSWSEKPTDECYSALRRSQTEREFYETIDRVIEELGIDIENVPQDDPQALSDFLFPVYVRLRETGYERWDLTG